MAVYKILEDVNQEDLDSSSAPLIRSLTKELAREKEVGSGSRNRAISVDQIYARTQYNSGTPLNNSFNFGTSLPNDFGRPFAHGWQQIAGVETRAELGRFSVYARGEYQHIPRLPAYNPSVAQIIATQDSTPLQSFPGRAATNDFRLLDTYISVHMLGHDISVGKQSYWWGPGSGSAMILSNNAEPFYSVRINRTTPLYIPWLSKLLGPFRYDNFFGKLSGHQFPPEPYFYGQKVNFSPTADLEFGFSRDAVIAGKGPTGTPLTLGNFWQSFTSTSSNNNGLQNVLGSRHASFDFRYRLPKLRNWVTLYADSLVHDDVSPLDAPRRAAVTPGIYLAKLPGAPKLDLHVEGGTTDTVTARAKGGQFYYYEQVYRDGYTNKGQLLGSWLGREGTGGQAWLTYWVGPQSTFILGYRTLKVSTYFVPQGLSQQDLYTRWRYAWRNGLAMQIFFQVERWFAPTLNSTPQTNVTMQAQVSFSPKHWNLSKR